MFDVQCARCSAEFCDGDIEKTPSFCPRRTARKELEEVKKIHAADATVKKITTVAYKIETEGYNVWPRAQELVEFSKSMHYKRLGIAFCVGLKEETRTLCTILDRHNFSISSVCCSIEGGCNPVGQAVVLNKANTELNVVMGLCIGHDILFAKFSKAPVTTLVVKDRVTCHNPVAPLENRSWQESLLKKK